MNKLNLLLAVGLIGAGAFNTSLRADDENVPPGHKKNGVPPGLQKKGGLPPGQAKKQARYGQPDAPQAPGAPASPTPTTVNAPPTPAVSTPATPAPPAPPAPTTTTVKVPEPPKPTTPEPPKAVTPEVTKPAQPVNKVVAERRAKLEKHVADLDTLGKGQAARDQMFVRLNRRIDVPLGTLEAELKAHPKIGIGGLVAGHMIAKRAKQPAEKIFAAHDSGKSWGEIAGEHKIELTELNEGLASAKESARAAERESAKR